MATRIPLVIVNGQLEQLQSGDQILASQAVTDVRTLTNGESSAAITIGMAVYISGPGSVKRAQANALSTSSVAGIVYDASISAAASGIIAVGGILVATTTQWDAVAGTTGGLVAGTAYYLDPTTPGKLTSTAPTSVGQVVTQLGQAINTTDFEINIQRTILL